MSGTRRTTYDELRFILNTVRSDSVIETQVRTLNAPYYTTGLTFELAGIDRTVNATLFTKAGPGSVWQTEMKAALRTGSVSDLNVYSVG
jgi:hypothetical protein